MTHIQLVKLSLNSAVSIHFMAWISGCVCLTPSFERTTQVLSFLFSVCHCDLRTIDKDEDHRPRVVDETEDSEGVGQSPLQLSVS